MPKSVMLTHANVGANVSQNLHPGSHTNHSATGILHLVIFLDKIEYTRVDYYKYPTVNNDKD